MVARGEKLYGYAGRLRDAFAIIDKAKDVSKRNKKDIHRFADHCTAEGLSLARTVKYVFTLRTLAQLLDKDFEKADKDDIEALMGKIERSERCYSEYTKKDFRICIKKFYRWLRGTEEGYPPEVKWLKTTLRPDRKKIPQELLTEDDIKKLMDAATTPRDKALIITLYESGARIGELAGAKIKHLTFDDVGSAIIVIGKTGMRRIRLIAADAHLRRWLNEHPGREDPNSPLWVKNNGDQMSYPTIAGLISRITKRAGLKKHVHAHLFRHSRATFLAKHLTEAQLSMYMGWVQGTRMASTYVHLAGRDIDDAILGIYGIQTKKEEEGNGHIPALGAPKVCPRCGDRNPGDASFCFKCGLALDMKKALEAEADLRIVERVFEEIRSNPEYKGLVDKVTAEIAMTSGVPPEIEKNVLDKVVRRGPRQEPPDEE